MAWWCGVWPRGIDLAWRSGWRRKLFTRLADPPLPARNAIRSTKSPSARRGRRCHPPRCRDTQATMAGLPSARSAALTRPGHAFPLLMAVAGRSAGTAGKATCDPMMRGLARGRCSATILGVMTSSGSKAWAFRQALGQSGIASRATLGTAASVHCTTCGQSPPRGLRGLRGIPAARLRVDSRLGHPQRGGATLVSLGGPCRPR